MSLLDSSSETCPAAEATTPPAAADAKATASPPLTVTKGITPPAISNAADYPVSDDDSSMPSLTSAISYDGASDNGTQDGGASDDGASDNAASDDDSASESSRSSSEGDEDHSETRATAENVVKEAATLINEASAVDMEALCDIINQGMQKSK